MLNKLRVRVQEEKGFTLVELLVVMLILGLLAAIAIPSFFNQRDKARDADAKASARTAQTAMETYATDNRGSYAAPATGTMVDRCRRSSRRSSTPRTPISRSPRRPMSTASLSIPRPETTSLSSDSPRVRPTSPATPAETQAARRTVTGASHS